MLARKINKVSKIKFYKRGFLRGRGSVANK